MISGAKNIGHINVWPTRAEAVRNDLPGSKQIGRLTIWPTTVAAKAHTAAGIARAVYFDGNSYFRATSLFSETFGFGNVHFWAKFTRQREEGSVILQGKSIGNLISIRLLTDNSGLVFKITLQGEGSRTVEVTATTNLPLNEEWTPVAIAWDTLSNPPTINIRVGKISVSHSAPSSGTGFSINSAGMVWNVGGDGFTNFVGGIERISGLFGTVDHTNFIAATRYFIMPPNEFGIPDEGPVGDVPFGTVPQIFLDGDPNSWLNDPSWTAVGSPKFAADDAQKPRAFRMYSTADGFILGLGTLISAVFGAAKKTGYSQFVR